MRKMDSWQNYTSIWWSKKKLLFFHRKNILEIVFLDNEMLLWFNEICLNPSKISLKISLKIWENIACGFKMFFFDGKIKVEKKLDHHINVEFCQESIYHVSRTFRILFPWLWALLFFFTDLKQREYPPDKTAWHVHVVGWISPKYFQSVTNGLTLFR